MTLRVIYVIPHAHWRRMAAAIVKHDAVLLLLAERAMEAGQEGTEGFAFELRASARTRVIATSCEALTTHGEWVYPLRPLPVPADDVADLLNRPQPSMLLYRAAGKAIISRT